ncbi:NUDIX hydrolase [Paenibacillus curdlanolyticus YK9]|uniref:NUDIX hydrolase n=1 Tax=Paenibacillus curdlanolyticus YK9 TaxID=717606 RepID=E0I5Z9_9BACL|nr:NUDIX domain-containing protein [Paenibacillus curdlanolyticus]EFM12391.1 NUDIX hydrolase [Paenibacillus curdlanolyticus YK9]
MTINYCVTCGSPMETRVLDGLERRVCASESCGAVHWGNYSIGVGALVFRDGKILLVRRAQEPGKGNWTNPGGYIEQHEDIGTTVAREVMEETGVEAKVKSIIALRDQPRSIHNVYIAFEMEYVGGEPTPDGVEVDAAGFFALDELAHMPVAGFTQWLLDAAIHKQGEGMQEDSQAATAANGNRYYRL